MSRERDSNREWLLEGTARSERGWEAINVETFGMEGALDLLALQEGRFWEVDLRHRPFVRDDTLKTLVLEARAADLRMNRHIHEIQSAAWEQARSS